MSRLRAGRGRGTGDSHPIRPPGPLRVPAIPAGAHSSFRGESRRGFRMRGRAGKVLGNGREDLLPAIRPESSRDWNAMLPNWAWTSRASTIASPAAPWRDTFAGMWKTAGHLGVRATPTFFIGQQRVEGVLTAAQFSQLVAGQLASLGVTVAGNVEPDNSGCRGAQEANHEHGCPAESAQRFRSNHPAGPQYPQSNRRPRAIFDWFSGRGPGRIRRGCRERPRADSSGACRPPVERLAAKPMPPRNNRR